MLPEWSVKFGEWVGEKYALVKGRLTGSGGDAENDLSGAAEAGDEVVVMSDLGRGVRKAKLLTAAGVERTQMAGEPYEEEGRGGARRTLDGGNSGSGLVVSGGGGEGGELTSDELLTMTSAEGLRKASISQVETLLRRMDAEDVDLSQKMEALLLKTFPQIEEKLREIARLQTDAEVLIIQYRTLADNPDSTEAVKEACAREVGAAARGARGMRAEEIQKVERLMENTGKVADWRRDLDERQREFELGQREFQRSQRNFEEALKRIDESLKR